MVCRTGWLRWPCFLGSRSLEWGFMPGATGACMCEGADLRNQRNCRRGRYPGDIVGGKPSPFVGKTKKPRQKYIPWPNLVTTTLNRVQLLAGF